MIIRPLFFYLLFFLLAASKAVSQDFPLRHFTIEDGLPSNTVYEVYRDSKGFLWFGTDKGVARYNGARFETFTTFNGLPDNDIFFFQEDLYGRLWLGTYSGDLCYYKDDTFHTAANTPFLKLPFKTPFIKYISAEKDSSVSITFSEEETKFINVGKDKFSIYSIDQTKCGLPFGRILLIKKTQGGYDVTYNNKEISIDNRSNIVHIVGAFAEKLVDRFSCQNSVYFCTKNTFFSSDSTVRYYVRKYPIEEDKVHRIYVDGKNVYQGANDGLVIDDSFKILRGNKVSSITQDNINNYWISTINDGVFMGSFFNTKLYRNVYNDEIKYSCVRHNRIFFTATNNDLYCINNGTINCLFDYRKYKHASYTCPNEPGYLLDENYKYYMFFNNDNFIMNNVLWKNKEIKKYSIRGHSDGIKSITELNGQVYLQDRRAIFKIDYDKIKTGEEVSKKYYSIADAGIFRIFCLANAPDNTIWYATTNDIYKVINSRSVIQPQFKNISFRFFRFCGERIVGYTDNNQLLVCSNFENKMVVDSIPYQNCVWDRMYVIDTNHVLISTNNLYRLLTLHRGAGVKDSISIIENPYIPLQAESICIDSANCYFFKNGSITSVTINSLFIKPPPPKLSFTSLASGKTIYRIDNELQIPFSVSRHITISFSTLSTAGKNVFYQYSISKTGKDNWRDITGDINLVNTGYGNYTIKIRAKTYSSSYCIPAVFTLHILRPFWATWWFVMLCICITGIIVWLFIRGRIVVALRKKEKEHKSEIRFMRSEYKALNALMNPHFIFNTLNNVQALVNKDDRLGANQYLRVFADLIRQNMQNISRDMIPLQREIALVSNYLILEKLRFEDKLDYTIDIDESLDLSEIMVPPLLIQPLVENSIKHGIYPLADANGFVQISIQQQNETLYIEVKDNGVGMNHAKNKKDMESESFGLENIRKRIGQLSIIQNKEITFNINDVTDDSGVLQGTTAIICIPGF